MTETVQLERIDAVLEQRGDRRTQLYDDIKAGTWPHPLKIGRGSYWPKYETQTLLRARIAGADAEQLRVLVRALLQQRRALMPRLEALSGAAAPEAAPEIDAGASQKRNTPKRPSRRNASA